MATCAWGWGSRGPEGSSLLCLEMPTHQGKQDAAPRTPQLQPQTHTKEAAGQMAAGRAGEVSPAGMGQSGATSRGTVAPRGRGEGQDEPLTRPAPVGWGSPRLRPEDRVPPTPSRHGGPGPARLCHSPRPLSPLAAPQIRAAEKPPPRSEHTRTAHTPCGSHAPVLVPAGQAPHRPHTPGWHWSRQPRQAPCSAPRKHAVPSCTTSLHHAPAGMGKLRLEAHGQ